MKKSIFGILFFFACSASTWSQETQGISLKMALELALENNPQVKAAIRHIDGQRGSFWRSISPPPLTASVNYAFVPIGAGFDQFSERTIELSQAFDFPTTIVLRGLLASTEISAAEVEYATIVNEISAQVKIAYCSVLAKKQKLDLAKENQSIAEEFARKSSIRRTVGEGTMLEQLTANVQRTQAQNALETAANELRIASNELELHLGIHRDSMRGELTLADSVVRKPHSLTLEQLNQIASVSNTQLRGSSTQRDIASAGYSLAWSSLLPNFSASYFRQTRDGISGLYGVSLSVSVPLWFLFDQRGQIQSASANFSIAEYELLRTQNSVAVAVKTAFYETLNNERQLELFHTEILPQAAEILRTAKASFDAGDITYLEFLQARQTVVQARASYIDVLFSYNVAMARLEQTIGKTLE